MANILSLYDRLKAEREGVGRTLGSSISALHDWLDRYLRALEQDNASPYTIKNYGTDIAQLDACETQGSRRSTA